jgi:O-antigen/teichoic acid export membrane protein
MFNGVMTSTVLPAATSFVAAGDLVRVRELFMRGLKYTLAAVVPIVVVIIVMPGAILEAWLGPKFTPVAAATGVFCSLWLLAANSSMSGLLLYASGRLRLITALQWVVALINLGLALVLTPAYGLNGTIAATMTGLAISTVVSLTVALRQFDMDLATVARRAWLPAYSTGAVVGAGLVVVHATLGIHGLVQVAVAGGGALLAYGALYARWWLDPSERRLALRTLGR